MICELGDLPWYVPLSVGVNCRAATATLTDPAQGNGILDYL